MIVSIITFLIVLSILILVHEFGHYWAAKKSGVLVEEFGIGYPPRIFGKKIGETLYSINILPFGGFVRLHGVFMNFLLAILAFAVVYSFSGISRETNDVRVVEVVAGSPAQTAKILVGDIIRKVDDQGISSVSEFVNLIDSKKGERTTLEVERISGGEKIFPKISIKPRENPPEDEGPLGIVITSVEVYYPPVWQRPFVGVYYGVKEALFWGGTLVKGFAGLIKNLFVGEVPKDIAGPVGIFALTSRAAEYGILPLINFVGILSINLMILNVLPFPALDGGRLLFIGIESITGKRVWPKLEATIHTIGMLVLIILLLAITVQDIRRLVSNGGLSGFIDSVLR